MRINFEATTNKPYVMINTLKLRLNSGSVVTLDRKETYYSISEPDDNNKYKLDMEWEKCYLWAIDDEYLFNEEPMMAEDIENLFKNAKFVDLELEDDADSDYYVHVDSLSVDSTPIKMEMMPVNDLYAEITSFLTDYEHPEDNPDYNTINWEGDMYNLLVEVHRFLSK